MNENQNYKFLEFMPSNIDIKTLERDDFDFLKKWHHTELVGFDRTTKGIELKILIDKQYSGRVEMYNHPRGIKMQGVTQRPVPWSVEWFKYCMERQLTNEKYLTMTR